MRIPALILLIGTLAGSAPAQTPAKTPDSAVRDPRAMAALDRMGTALRALKSFAVTAEISDEDVLTDGQKLQYLGTILLRAQQPNALRADSVSDRESRTIYYDGKSLTIFAPTKGFYATVAAPPSIHQLIDKVQADYGIQVPLADLFSWGTDKALIASITSALPVGSDTIDGVECDHFAMRQKGNDWQVWIRREGPALPCRYVITTTDDPAMPQYGVVLHWETGAAIPPDTFAFTPPANAQKIAVGKPEGKTGPAS